MFVGASWWPLLDETLQPAGDAARLLPCPALLCPQPGQWGWHTAPGGERVQGRGRMIPSWVVQDSRPRCCEVKPL